VLSETITATEEYIRESRRAFQRDFATLPDELSPRRRARILATLERSIVNTYGHMRFAIDDMIRVVPNMEPAFSAASACDDVDTTLFGRDG